MSVNDSDIKKYTYFQFFKELDLPLYVRVELGRFAPELVTMLATSRFEELSESEGKKVLKGLKDRKNSRLLTINEAGIGVARQLGISVDGDRFGPETIIPRDGYRIYRYRGLALMIYSFNALEWEMGALSHLGQKDRSEYTRIVLNRFLSLALAPFGFLGLWGVPVDEGIVVMKSQESKGEAVFIDLLGRQILTLDGARPLKGHFSILKLDPVLKGRNIKMSPEELLGFLTLHCTYLDYQGPSVPIRQLIQTLSKTAEGLIHPKESFKPRTDLSL